MIRTLPARARTAAVAACLVVLAAGCGVSTSPSGEGGLGTASSSVEAGRFDGSGGSAYLSQVAEATGRVTTQKVSMEVRITGLPVVGEVTARSEGELDNEAHRAKLRLDMGDLFESFGTASGVPQGSQVIDTIVDGDTVYMRSPLLSRLSDSSKPWLRVDAGDLGQAGAFSGGAQSDPGQFLDFLRGAGTVTDLGTETVRGIETSHVKADIDVAKLVAAAPQAERKRLEDALASLGAGDSLQSIPMEAWVDGDGYVRKVTMSFDLSGLSGSSGGAPSGLDEGASADMTIEFFDFDQPVDIAVPDPSEVGTLDASILGAGGN